MIINPNINSVTAFAPATCANMAVGFDILGFAMAGVGDTITLIKRDDENIVIESIDSNETLPLDVKKNTASVVIQQLCEDLNLKIGLSIQLKKGIALGSGMGGSAASAVAALTAFNGFLNQPLSRHELAHYALLGEEVASGQAHADNIVPCIFGGLTLIRSIDPIDVISLPIPNLFCVIVHPHHRVDTKEARSILKTELPLKDYVKQSANLAAFIVALYEKNNSLLQQSMFDVLIEPQRSVLVPGFYAVKNAALKAGALASSLSGSGPSVFALAQSHVEAEAIRAAMRACFKNEGLTSDAWVSQMSSKGAHVTATTFFKK